MWRKRERLKVKQSDGKVSYIKKKKKKKKKKDLRGNIYKETEDFF